MALTTYYTCKNPACLAAATQLRKGLCHACYERARLAGEVEGMVLAEPARCHLSELVLAGWRLNEIARAAGVYKATVRLILEGQRDQIQSDTRDMILAVDPDTRETFMTSRWITRAKERWLTSDLFDLVWEIAHVDHKLWLAAEANERSRRKTRAEERDNLAAMAAADERVRVELAPILDPLEIEQTSRERAQRGFADREVLALLGPSLLEEDVDEYDYPDDAICSTVDPEIFFPEKGGSTREAKRICQGCPVRTQCLEDALSHDERFGIWGGYSERERRALKKGVQA